MCKLKQKFVFFAVDIVISSRAWPLDIDITSINFFVALDNMNDKVDGTAE